MLRCDCHKNCVFQRDTFNNRTNGEHRRGTGKKLSGGGDRSETAEERRVGLACAGVALLKHYTNSEHEPC